MAAAVSQDKKESQQATEDLGPSSASSCTDTWTYAHFAGEICVRMHKIHIVSTLVTKDCPALQGTSLFWVGSEEIPAQIAAPISGLIQRKYQPKLQRYQTL
jgi:hypothetical protein